MQAMIIAVALLLLSGCDLSSLTTGNRWYTESQVQNGKWVFQMHCAECHGSLAQGLADDWRQRLPDGSYPPPPLNGTAHAWHHSLPLLLEIIQQGGSLYKGTMPGFKDVLTDEQQLAVIAWFQSLWSDEIYEFWAQADGTHEQQGGHL